MKKRILVVSAHPDDETLGCGGTLLRHRQREDDIGWCIFTKGADGPFSGIRKRELEKVSGSYGVKRIFDLGFSASKLDLVGQGEMIKLFSAVLSKVKPAIIYTVGGTDIHSDHKAVFGTVMRASKPPDVPYLTTILSYEVLSSTEWAPPGMESKFSPNWFIDISDFIEDKIKTLGFYKSQVRKRPHPRNGDVLKALGRYRGATIGVDYAEAFCLARNIEK
jgi:LmbE family N-acetylglucosaminyl deacetylase